MLTDSIAVLLGCIALSEGFNLLTPNESVIFAYINKLNHCIILVVCPISLSIHSRHCSQRQ